MKCLGVSLNYNEVNAVVRQGSVEILEFWVEVAQHLELKLPIANEFSHERFEPNFLSDQQHPLLRPCRKSELSILHAEVNFTSSSLV